MLECLSIRKIALIDEAEIRFHPGMQVMTGETGAGKSIVVDSVNLILGGRADKDLIRTGSEKASVEAVFNTRGNDRVRAFLDQEAIEYDGESVTVYREITTAGRNVCRICGVLIPASKLKEISPLLMDIHGQSEHQFLADPARHLAFLDQTGDESHRKALREVADAWGKFMDNHRAYARLVKAAENRDMHMRSLEHDMGELRKAKIKKGEITELTEKRKRLEKAEKNAEAFRNINEKLSGTDGGSAGLALIKDAAAALKSVAGGDEKLTEISEKCEEVYYELEEIAYQVSLYTQRMGSEPGSLEQTDERLDLIHRLERKHGCDADKLPEMLAKMEAEYDLLSGMEEEIARMGAEHKKLLSAYRTAARRLTEKRHELAEEFERKMSQELGDLGMGNTRFQVMFAENETGRPLMPTEKGDDRVEFLISPNPGEPLKSLSKIASGGELSLLMLAIKSLETSRSGLDAMVFDEIDTGISGRMAQTVAEKMTAIATGRQVICVTHLPQIAAAADYHYLVTKEVRGERTNTTVTELDEDGRIKEVSRMISGADGVTAESDAYAARMLQAAKERKPQDIRCTMHHES